MIIRRPKPDECDAVRALVQAVVDEIYGDTLGPPTLPIGDEDWSLAWIAVADTQIVGIVLTQGEWISDLWVRKGYRGSGIGRRLLLHGEDEIAGRGHRVFHLRVVKSNSAAVDFYRRMGWEIAREFSHETLATTMLELIKACTSPSG